MNRRFSDKELCKGIPAKQRKCQALPQNTQLGCRTRPIVDAQGGIARNFPGEPMERKEKREEEQVPVFGAGTCSERGLKG
jgi:hypothetical protein